MKGVTLAVPGTGIRVTVSGTEIDRLSPLSASWLPSGDRMIQSLVPIFGVRTIAIVLSGMLPAGVEGIRAVRACGGITMAQNRASASDFEMPSAAIDFGRAEIVAPPWRMAEMLTLLAEEWSVPLVSAKSFVTATPKGVRGASRA
jgi:chemotaxis response regulator CheB